MARYGAAQDSASPQRTTSPDLRKARTVKDMRSVSAERPSRQTVYESIGEFDTLNKKIQSVLKANEALPSQGIVITEMTCGEPETEKAGNTQTGAEGGNRLQEWLKDARLEEIYVRLVESGFDDLEELVSQQASDMPLTCQLLQDIGIVKAGQRYTLLAALELETKTAAPPARKPRHTHTYSCMNPYTAPSTLLFFPTLPKWLSSLNLEQYTSAFQAAGFKHYDQLLAVMHTSYRLTETMLETELTIKKLGHRHRILGSLQEAAAEADPWRLMFTSGGRRYRLQTQRVGREEVNKSCAAM